jgi:hypothetical protein
MSSQGRSATPPRWRWSPPACWLECPARPSPPRPRPWSATAASRWALAGHGAWGVVHYRRHQVLHRSLAEFCVLLDVPLGVGAIVLAIVA